MSERYSKLFALSENLYSAGAPVVIAAGALQKDNQTGKVFAQLKIRNIQDKVIKAATVKITPFDTVGKPLGGTVDYQYLDLSAGRDTDFGQKTPVMLKEATARSFAVSVSEIIFADNSTWSASDGTWEALSATDPIKQEIDKRLADKRVMELAEAKNKKLAMLIAGVGAVLILLGIVLLFSVNLRIRLYIKSDLTGLKERMRAPLIPKLLAGGDELAAWQALKPWSYIFPVLAICSGTAWAITGVKKVKNERQRLTVPIVISALFAIAWILMLFNIL
ncbi:MAG: hypothetical protein HFF74_04730 [Oscillospiraceae bacterium]|nr:hypothetical protein [Oscillospiraceae bacterium]